MDPKGGFIVTAVEGAGTVELMISLYESGIKMVCGQNLADTYPALQIAKVVFWTIFTQFF